MLSLISTCLNRKNVGPKSIQFTNDNTHILFSSILNTPAFNHLVLAEPSATKDSLHQDPQAYKIPQKSESVSKSQHSLDLSKESTLPPIFVYGTLMAADLLAWVLTGDHRNGPNLQTRYTPATLKGHKRVPVRGSDYPALICHEDPSSTVNGFLVYPKNEDEWRKLDNFEGEIYKRAEVMVEVLKTDSGKGGGMSKPVKVFAYPRDDVIEKLEVDEEWNFEFFKENRLEDWLNLFDGVEMV